MLAARALFKPRLNSVELLRRFIRSGIAASAVAHLSILAIITLFAEVHPFGAVTAEPMTVEIVTPDEAPPAREESFPDLNPDPNTPRSDAFDLAAKSADRAASAPAPAPTTAPAAPSQPAANRQPQAAKPQAAAKPEPAPKPQQQAALSTPVPDAVPSADAPSQPPSSAPSPVASSDPSSGFTPPPPDLTVKYHVMLGLPPALPPPAGSVDRPGDGIDATASTAADIASGPVAEFRRKVRTCSKLPASVAASDKIRIKLRVQMTPEGRLAADPILIEASASAKGPLLMQSAISALTACQPYAMLPADKYREWKVLDLSFTPQDLGGG
jgi:hypothetical protein